MSISSQVAKSGPFTITALPQTIPVVFPFQEASDLLVSAGGTPLVLGSDYTVAGGGYNAANAMQTGSIVVVSGGASDLEVGDILAIARAVPLTQETSLVATGPLTAALIEQALDKSVTLAQQELNDIYNPFAPLPGAPNLITLGSITGLSGGATGDIDTLPVEFIPTSQLPLFIAVSIGDVYYTWKLRAIKSGDPGVTTLPNYIVPVTNPNGYIWVSQ